MVTEILLVRLQIEVGSMWQKKSEVGVFKYKSTYNIQEGSVGVVK